mmetsp:Transcript_37652/g.75341  ORF Transcript_37652/g.75341 Transcript_37652/m.75341 type:complete len:179 (-) Transcript_37652:166-702(-)
MLRVGSLQRQCLLLTLVTELTAFSTGGLSLQRHSPTAFQRWHGPRADAADPLTVTHLLKDLEYLGPCRFVLVGPGAILEAVGSFDSLRCNDKGLATVSNDDNSFECHIRLNEVRSAQFARKETANKTMHIVRLLGDDQKPLLSAILHPEDGDDVDEGAIEFWESLRNRFGEDVALVNE